MKNKYLVELRVPEIEEVYSVYLPVQKKVGTVILLLTKAIHELSRETYPLTYQNSLYDAETGEKYDINQLVKDSNIDNGSKLILI